MPKDENGNPIDPQEPTTTEPIADTEVPNPSSEHTEPETGTGNPNDSMSDTGKEKPDSSKKQKGAWISQLPKSMRSKVDPEKYPTIADFAKELLGEEDTAPDAETTTEEESQPEEEQDDWSEFEIEDDGSVDVSTAKNLIDKLKESGFKSKEAKKVIDIIIATNETRSNSQFEESKKALATNLKKLWGDDAEERKQDMQKGFARIYPTEELRKSCLKSGIMLNADFCNALAEVGRLSKETPPPKSTPSSPKPTKTDRWSK